MSWGCKCAACRKTMVPTQQVEAGDARALVQAGGLGGGTTLVERVPLETTLPFVVTESYGPWGGGG